MCPNSSPVGYTRWKRNWLPSGFSTDSATVTPSIVTIGPRGDSNSRRMARVLSKRALSSSWRPTCQ